MKRPRIRDIFYRLFDRIYVPTDKKYVRRTRNLRLIPHVGNRRGGKRSYAEWAHVVGIFQTMLATHLTRKSGNRILDVGCGTGLLGIAAEPFVGDGGQYVGIDVSRADIDFCKKHYREPHFQFMHLDVTNPHYAPDGSRTRAAWDLPDASFDMVTALSVWTHLDEDDARFYFKEVARVLKPEGKAIITFFVMDDIYEKSLSMRTNVAGRYHHSLQTEWVFDMPIKGSDAWFTPKWATVPEQAVAVSSDGIARLVNETGLRRVAAYGGNWKECPGAYIQDILVFQKPDD